MDAFPEALSNNQQRLKRSFDVVVSGIGILLSLPLQLLLLVLCSIDTRSFGLLSQTRIGQYGRRFRLWKFKSMRGVAASQDSITTANDPRITRLGRVLRKTKLDELPQLWNVLIGNMSLVGPRPDVPGYADQLKSDDRIILSVRPGITGPASIKFKDEEELLSKQSNPKQYNDEVIWPQKVKINKAYVENYRFKNDLMYVIKTILG
ncbi:MAG: sugar transferase [Bacteroidetes bacterium]|jgi:lipopolysaccharide/colanic/teichoic acid biosynthesis glycosyltransferase|nr:sugar transferase [Bacteroidota bacterium]